MRAFSWMPYVTALHPRIRHAPTADPAFVKETLVATTVYRIPTVDVALEHRSW
jgi:hypothetical protein